jgi:hypothetical protein
MPGFGPDNPHQFGVAGGKGQPEPSPARERPNSSTPITEELDNLYVLLRGARYANALGEAKKAFQAKDYAETLKLVRETGELHRRMHLQVLKQDPNKSGIGKKELQKILDKQAKLKGVLERFDELVHRLEKMAKLEPEKPETPVSARPLPAPKPRPAPQLSADFLTKFQAADGGDAQFQTVCNEFIVTEVETEDDIKLGALYCLLHQGQIHLIRCSKIDGAPAMFTMQLILFARSLKPVPLEKLIDLGEKKLLHRIMPVEQDESEAESPGNAADDMSKQTKGLHNSLIDMGSFSQLQTAAQLTGLLPNADAIGFVRDHEFRTGKYQAAFDRIEAIFMHMRAAAEQRAQKLKQEDHYYRSGTLKISPKEWMIKQQRDTEQTQKIDRTLRYFARILDGLRVMITSSFDTPPQGPAEET